MYNEEIAEKKARLEQLNAEKARREVFIAIVAALFVDVIMVLFIPLWLAKGNEATFLYYAKVAGKYTWIPIAVAMLYIILSWERMISLFRPRWRSGTLSYEKKVEWKKWFAKEAERLGAKVIAYAKVTVAGIEYDMVPLHAEAGNQMVASDVLGMQWKVLPNHKRKTVIVGSGNNAKEYPYLYLSDECGCELYQSHDPELKEIPAECLPKLIWEIWNGDLISKIAYAKESWMLLIAGIAIDQCIMFPIYNPELVAKYPWITTMILFIAAGVIIIINRRSR